MPSRTERTSRRCWRRWRVRQTKRARKAERSWVEGISSALDRLAASGVWRGHGTSARPAAVAADGPVKVRKWLHLGVRWSVGARLVLASKLLLPRMSVFSLPGLLFAQERTRWAGPIWTRFDPVRTPATLIWICHGRWARGCYHAIAAAAHPALHAGKARIIGDATALVVGCSNGHQDAGAAVTASAPAGFSIRSAINLHVLDPACDGMAPTAKPVHPRGMMLPVARP